MVYRRVRVQLDHPNAITFMQNLCWDLYNISYAMRDDLDVDDFQPTVDVPMESKGPVEQLPSPIGALVRLRALNDVKKHNKVAKAMERAGGYLLDAHLTLLRSDFPKIVVDGERNEVHIKLGYHKGPYATEATRNALEVCLAKHRRQFGTFVLSDDDEETRARLRRHPQLCGSALSTMWANITLAFPVLNGREDARADFENHQAVDRRLSGGYAPPIAAQEADMLSVDKVTTSVDGVITAMRWKSFRTATRAFEQLGFKEVRCYPGYTSHELAAEIKQIVRERGLHGPSEVMAIEDGGIVHVERGPLFETKTLARFQKLKVVSGQLGADASAYMQVMVRSKETTPGFLSTCVMGQIALSGAECARHILRSDESMTPMGVVYCGTEQYVLPSSMHGLSVRKAAAVVLALVMGADTLVCDLCFRPITVGKESGESGKSGKSGKSGVVVETAQRAHAAEYGSVLGRRAWLEEREMAFSRSCGHVFHRRCVEAAMEADAARGSHFVCPRSH